MKHATTDIHLHAFYPACHKRTNLKILQTYVQIFLYDTKVFYVEQISKVQVHEYHKRL